MIWFDLRGCVKNWKIHKETTERLALTVEIFAFLITGEVNELELGSFIS